MAAGRFNKPPTTLEAVLAEVRRSLLEGEYPPGTRLNVDGISKTLGLSRAPVRDALRVLEGEKQVAYEPHRGYFIPEMEIDQLFDLYRMRELLESEAAALALPILAQSDFAEIADAADSTLTALEAGDRIAATYANRVFHFRLLTSPGHERLLAEIVSSWNADGYRAVYLRDLDQSICSAKEHFSMLEAAKARDVPLFIRLQHEHREGELRSLLSQLPNVDGAALMKSKRWRAIQLKSSGPRRSSAISGTRPSRGGQAAL